MSLCVGGGSDVVDACRHGNHISSFNGKIGTVGKVDVSPELGGFSEHDALSVVVENLVMDIVVEEVFDVGDFGWHILAFHTHGERASVFAWGWIETHFAFSRALRNNRHNVAMLWEVGEYTIFAKLRIENGLWIRKPFAVGVVFFGVDIHTFVAPLAVHYPAIFNNFAIIIIDQGEFFIGVLSHWLPSPVAAAPWVLHEVGEFRWFATRKSNHEFSASAGCIVEFGEVEAERHGARFFKVERDVATIVHRVAFLAAGFKNAAEVVGPRAVGGEFHHIVFFAHWHIVEGDFIHLVGHLCHLVGVGIDNPVRTVEPCTHAIAHGYHLLHIENVGLHAAAGHGRFESGGVESDGHVASGSHIEGDVVVGFVAIPFHAIFHHLELVAVLSRHVGEGFGIGAIAIVSHFVVVVGAVPNCAAKFFRPCHNVNVFSHC